VAEIVFRVVNDRAVVEAVSSARSAFVER